MRLAVKELARVMRDYGRTEAQRELGLLPRFATLPESTGDADDIVNGFFREIETEAREIVKRVIVDGGGNTVEAMLELSRAFPEWSKGKQERIARTVAAFYFNRGRIDVFLGAGIEHFGISAILDSRVCPICFPLDGLIFSIYLDLPSLPPYHWSCRCIFYGIVEPDGPVIRTVQELQRAADRRLQEAGFMIGKKAITKWPGVPPGWGTMPPGLKPKITPEPPRGLIPSVLRWLTNIVSGLGFAATPVLRTPGIDELRLIVAANYDVFGMSADLIVEAVRKEYNLDEVMTLSLALAYVEEVLRRKGRL